MSDGGEDGNRNSSDETLELLLRIPFSELFFTQIHLQYFPCLV